MKIISRYASNLESEIGGADDALKFRNAIGSLPGLHLVQSKLILMDHLVIRQIIWNEIVVLIHIVYIA